jgi:hypothetical protein
VGGEWVIRGFKMRRGGEGREQGERIAEEQAKGGCEAY